MVRSPGEGTNKSNGAARVTQGKLGRRVGATGNGNFRGRMFAAFYFSKANGGKRKIFHGGGYPTKRNRYRGKKR